MTTAGRRGKARSGTNLAAFRGLSSPISLMERYALAINSQNMSNRSSTVRSDSDILGAMALAGARISRTNEMGWSHAGADALARVMAGDDRAMTSVVDAYAERLLEHSRAKSDSISEPRARAIATACLAWFVKGRCLLCEGRRTELAQDSHKLTSTPCTECGGTGKVSFVKNFPSFAYRHAKWLATQMINDLRVCEDEIEEIVIREDVT